MSSFIDKLRGRREQTKVGAAERARDKDEENQVKYAARRKGRLRGIAEYEEKKGFESAGKGNPVTGFFKGSPKTVTTRTVRGKGKNRRVTTTTREVKGGGFAGTLKSLGFGEIGGPSADSFSLGSPGDMGIGFGSERSASKKRRSHREEERDYSRISL